MGNTLEQMPNRSWSLAVDSVQAPQQRLIAEQRASIRRFVYPIDERARRVFVIGCVRVVRLGFRGGNEGVDEPEFQQVYR